jgi:hypothetical protein
MVRDAICECFYEAHCKDAELSNEQSMGKPYCTQIVEKAFRDSGGDFEKPTKESIMNAMRNLAEFSKKFRNQEIIRKHTSQIMDLIERIE